MTTTRTFEPIRPIYAEDDGRAYYSDAMRSLGQPRVYYGHWHWPSHSYWLVPNTVISN
jgi:hypothetical protein